MKVIVILGDPKNRKSKKTHLMIELSNQKAIDDTKKLINAWKCSKAIVNIVSKGRFIRELTEQEIASEPSDLIVTNTNAHWSLL